jgi:hypothetical protein
MGSGDSGSQKANFWTWVAGLTPNNATPLRQALNAVGQYYMTNQPWQTSSSDATKLACRQAYTILTTDGFWNDSSVNLPSNSYQDNIDGGPGSTTTTTSSYNATLTCPAGHDGFARRSVQEIKQILQQRYLELPQRRNVPIFLPEQIESVCRDVDIDRA